MLMFRKDSDSLLSAGVTTSKGNQMFNNNFKARIRKWANLTQQDLVNLLRWGGSPNSNPNTLVCSASAGGETIAFMASEAVFVVTNYALKPGTAVSDLE